jgi:hypothetical protein
VSVKLEAFEFFTKSENRARLFSEKHVGEMALFCVHAIEGEKSVESSARDTDVRDVNIPFMISRTDGLANCEFLIRSGPTPVTINVLFNYFIGSSRKRFR